MKMVKVMRLFDFEKYQDYGWEFFFQILTSRRFSLLDITLGWDDYGSNEIFPTIQFSIGPSHLFGFYFSWHRFGFDCSIIDTKARDLGWYRKGESKYENLD